MRCVLGAALLVTTYIIGGYEELVRTATTMYDDVSEKTVDVPTWFGNKIELKYSARLFTLLVAAILLFIVWPLVRIVWFVIKRILSGVTNHPKTFGFTAVLSASVGFGMWYYEYTTALISLSKEHFPMLFEHFEL